MLEKKKHLQSCKIKCLLLIVLEDAWIRRLCFNSGLIHQRLCIALGSGLAVWQSGTFVPWKRPLKMPSNESGVVKMVEHILR